MEGAETLATFRTQPPRTVALGDPEYPPQLLDLRSPPSRVYLLGAWAPRHPRVAVVGARDASPEGCDAARNLAAELARAGVDILSGLARGVDTAAHRGALDAGGRSGAVLGTGLTRCYPRENAELQARLSRSLGLMSEVPPGAHASRATFAARNRLVAALADAVVIVQGRAQSGALLTVRGARNLGRPVGAVPWDPWEPQGEAPHALIRSGDAVLIRGAADALELLAEAGMPAGRALVPAGSPRRSEPPPGALGDEAERLRRALRRHPESVDVLAARAGLSAHATLAALAVLELEGIARRAPGGRVCRAGRS